MTNVMTEMKISDFPNDNSSDLDSRAIKMSAATNDGRNEIRVNNSEGRCLLENWVEERQVQHIDPQITVQDEGLTSKLQVLRYGHKGVLSTAFDAKVSDKTTVRDTYTPPVCDGTRHTGSKKELMEKMFYNKVCKEMQIGEDPGPEPTDFRSIKTVDYDFKFTPQVLPSTTNHNYRTEQPVTFWSEHKDKIHGVSQIKTRDAFRKNDAFSKPIGENWEEPKPYVLEDYPKM